MYKDIMSARVGFGKNTVGGAAAEGVTIVDTLADSGPGSAREALTTDDTPRWVIKTVPGAIEALSPMYVKSNKTIDGRSQRFDIHGNGRDVGPLRFYDVHDIIAINMSLDDAYPNWDSDTEGADGITMLNAANVWLHHCYFSRWSDGGCDIKGASHDITITRSMFYQIYQALVCEGNRITLAKSYARLCAARFPKALTGFTHSYNNVIREWKMASIMSVKDNGQHLSDYDLFYPAAFNKVGENAGGKWKINKPYQVNPITIVGGNDAVSTALSAEARSYAPDMVKPTTKEQWNALLDEVRNMAGAKLPTEQYPTGPAPDPDPEPDPDPQPEPLTLESLDARVKVVERRLDELDG